jgi:hypothetical protein
MMDKLFPLFLLLFAPLFFYHTKYRQNSLVKPYYFKNVQQHHKATFALTKISLYHEVSKTFAFPSLVTDSASDDDYRRCSGGDLGGRL